jgi:hypothetical protein
VPDTRSQLFEKMKNLKPILLLAVLFTSLALQSCDDNLKVRPFKVLELQNMEPNSIYFFVIAGNLSTVVDIAPTIPIDEVTFPKLLPNESILIETSEIDGYHVDESLTYYVYVEKTIEEDGNTKDVISYEFLKEVSAEHIRNNAGKILIRKPDYIHTD